MPTDVDGWAYNVVPLSPFQLLTDWPSPTYQDTLVGYSGAGPSGWTMSFQDALGGFPPADLTYDPVSGDFSATVLAPAGAPWDADCRWTPVALCSEQVVRSESLERPDLCAGYDEIIPTTGEVLVYDQPSYPPPGLRVSAVTGRGLVWTSAHMRGNVRKVHSLPPNRISGQTLRYVPL